MSSTKNNIKQEKRRRVLFNYNENDRYEYQLLKELDEETKEYVIKKIGDPVDRVELMNETGKSAEINNILNEYGEIPDHLKRPGAIYNMDISNLDITNYSEITKARVSQLIDNKELAELIKTGKATDQQLKDYINEKLTQPIKKDEPIKEGEDIKDETK